MASYGSPVAVAGPGQIATKFLFDECLSPSLATVARDAGFFGSTHVNWLGLSSQPDQRVVQRAIDDEYVVVTSDARDFTKLMVGEPHHAGLICLSISHVRNSGRIQQSLFEYVINEIGTWDFTGRLFSAVLLADGEVHISW